MIFTYTYVYPLKEKSKVVQALKIFINEVERKLEKKVKIIKSDRCGKYYGKYDKTIQCPTPFANF